MSSVVIALQSFINGRQLRISPTNMINLDDNKLLNDQNLINYFNAQTLSEFINHLYYLGEILSKKSIDYIKWYGKDTVLSGVFGGMGAYMIDSNETPSVEAIEKLIIKFENSDDPFRLKEYYDAYENKLVSTKVNVGNAVRKAIFNYTKDFLKQDSPNWYNYFSLQYDHDEE